jgi:hypothetical protein
MLRLYNLSGEEILILRNKGSYIPGEATQILNEIDLSGLKELKFLLPVTYFYNGIQTENERWSDIQTEMLIKYTDENDNIDWYKLKSTEDQHTDGRLTSNCQCKHISFDLGKKGNDKVIDITSTPTEILTEILKDTGWTLGTVDVALDAKVRTFQSEARSNVLEMLNKVAELFIGYLRFNGDKSIDFVENIGNALGEVSFRYKKNLKGIRRTIDTTNLVTKLFVYGGEDENGTIGIESVNSVNKQPFIQNFSYFIESGLMPASSTPTINQYNSNMLAVNTNIQNTQSLISTEQTSIITKQAQIETKKIQVNSITQLIAEIDNKLPVYAVGSTEYTNLTNEKTVYNSQKTTLQGEITTLEGEIATHNTNITTYTATLNGYISDKNDIESTFKTALGDFIFEGEFQDSSYVSATPTELYTDAVTLLEKACYPTISYSMSILDLSKLTGHSLESFSLGDRIFVYDELLKINTSLKISKIVRNLDKPQDTQIEISNINTPFQDLFKSMISSTTTLQKQKDTWNRSGTAINPGGNINETALQNTLNNSNVNIPMGTNNSGSTGSSGLVYSYVSNSSQKLRIDGGNIYVSIDNGVTWTPAFMIYDNDGTPEIGFDLGSFARGGRLDVSQVVLYGGSENTSFYWNKYGLFALDSATPTQNFIVFNKDGLKSTNDGGSTYVFEITSGGRAYFRDTVELPNAGMTSQGNLGTSTRIWAGATYANRDNAPFRVQQDGRVKVKDANDNLVMDSDGLNPLEISGFGIVNGLTFETINVVYTFAATPTTTSLATAGTNRLYLSSVAGITTSNKVAYKYSNGFHNDNYAISAVGANYIDLVSNLTYDVASGTTIYIVSSSVRNGSSGDIIITGGSATLPNGEYITVSDTTLTSQDFMANPGDADGFEFRLLWLGSDGVIRIASSGTSGTIVEIYPDIYITALSNPSNPRTTNLGVGTNTPDANAVILGYFLVGWALGANAPKVFLSSTYRDERPIKIERNVGSYNKTQLINYNNNSNSEMISITLDTPGETYLHSINLGVGISQIIGTIKRVEPIILDFPPPYHNHSDNLMGGIIITRIVDASSVGNFATTAIEISDTPKIIQEHYEAGDYLGFLLNATALDTTFIVLERAWLEVGLGKCTYLQMVFRYIGELTISESAIFKLYWGAL